MEVNNLKNMNGKKLEQQVKKILKSDDWQILEGAYYTDPNTQKPREKDIVARIPQNNYSYDAILFIECKCISRATQIYLKDTINEVENTLIACNIPFAKIFEIENNQQTHFYKKYVDFFESKDSEDFLYTAINQNLQSFNAFRKSNQQAGVYYLIVIYYGEVFYLNQNSERKKCDNALIQVNALDNTFNLPDKKCFIEIVSISQFANLLKEIQEDINQINQSACFYRRMEQNRINKNRQARKNNDYGL